MDGTKRRKKVRLGLYRDDDHKLLIPRPLMFRVREAAAKGPTSRGALMKAVAGHPNADLHLPRGETWLENWLWRGADLPNAVYAPTHDSVEACCRAWHYIELAKGVADKRLYHEWFDRVLPWTTLDELHDWALWLFAGGQTSPPPGWLIVPESLVALGIRLSPGGVSRAAGIGWGYGFVKWWKDPVLREAVQDAVRYAMRPGGEKHHPPKDSKAWAQLQNEGRNRADSSTKMRFANEATLAAALADIRLAGVALVKQGLDQWFETAAKIAPGLDDRLRAYVFKGHNSIFGNPPAPPFDSRFYQKYGVIDHGLFRPTPAMLAFRNAASKQWQANKVRAIRDRVVDAVNERCWKLWFLDSVIPRGQTARRNLRARKYLDEALKSPSEMAANGQAEHPGTNGSQVNASNGNRRRGRPKGTKKFSAEADAKLVTDKVASGLSASEFAAARGIAVSEVTDAMRRLRARK